MSVKLLTLCRSWWRRRFTDWRLGWECLRIHPQPSDDRKFLHTCTRLQGHFGKHRDSRGKEWP